MRLQVSDEFTLTASTASGAGIVFTPVRIGLSPNEVRDDVAATSHEPRSQVSPASPASVLAAAGASPASNGGASGNFSFGDLEKSPKEKSPPALPGARVAQAPPTSLDCFIQSAYVGGFAPEPQVAKNLTRVKDCFATGVRDAHAVPLKFFPCSLLGHPDIVMGYTPRSVDLVLAGFAPASRTLIVAPDIFFMPIPEFSLEHVVEGLVQLNSAIVQFAMDELSAFMAAKTIFANIAALASEAGITSFEAFQLRMKELIDDSAIEEFIGLAGAPRRRDNESWRVFLRRAFRNFALVGSKVQLDDVLSNMRQNVLPLSAWKLDYPLLCSAIRSPTSVRLHHFDDWWNAFEKPFSDIWKLPADNVDLPAPASPPDYLHSDASGGRKNRRDSASDSSSSASDSVVCLNCGDGGHAWKQCRYTTTGEASNAPGYADSDAEDLGEAEDLLSAPESSSDSV